MKTKILDLIDFKKVDTLLEGFNKSTGFVTAILDLDGNVLSKSGWRQICTEFHRVNPETAKKCTISDTVLAGKLAEGEKYHFYQCLNGLIDVAVPIVIKGEHIANLFSGQFFFEEPDSAFFKKQAEKYGFNEKIYLKALGKVPVVSKDKVLAATDFLLNMTQLISDMTFQKLEQMELNEAIQKNERILRLFVEHSPASIAMFDNNMHYLVASHRFLLDYNLGNQEVIGQSHYDVFPEISERWKEIHRRCLAGENISASNDPFPRADGTTDWVRWEIRPWYESENQIGGIILFSEVITTQVEAREALKESEKYNRMLFEQSAIGLLLTSLDGKLIDINQACAIIIGRTIEEAKTLTYWEITPEKYQNQEQQQLDLLAKTGRYGPYEKEYIHKDGYLVPVRLQGLIIERNNEKYIWSSVEDISEQKKAELDLIAAKEEIEASERNKTDLLIKFNEAQQSAKIGNWDWDMVTNKVWGSGELYRIFDLDPNIFVPSMEAVEKFIHPDDYESYQKEVQRVINNKEELNTELRIISGNGTLKYCNLRAKLELDNKGNPVRFYGTLADITERKKIDFERHRFAMLADSSSEFIGMCDLNLQPIYVNPSGIRMVGLTDIAEACRVKVQDYFFSEDQRFIAEEFFPRVLSEGDGGIEIRLRNFQTGEPIWVYYYLFRVCDDKGQPVGWATVSRDITERKQKEETLKKFEYILSEGQKIAHMGIFEYNVDTQTTYWSPEEYSIYGLDPEGPSPAYEIMLAKCIHPDDAAILNQTFGASLKGHSVYELEHRIIRPDGTIRWVFDRAAPYFDQNSKLVRYVGVTLDITDRKESEEKIKENLNLLKIAGEKAKLGGWNVDLKENRSYWSDVVAAIHEMPPGYSPLVEDGINFYAPEWREKIKKVFTECAQYGIPYDEEMEIITSTGKRVWVRTIGETVRNEEGEIFKVEGAFQDITENKRADEAIRKAHDQLTKIILTSPNIICSAHLQSDGTVCFPFGGERLAEYYGIPEANLARDSSPYQALIHPDDNENVYASIMESAKQLSPWRCEYRMIHPVKGVLWIEGHSMPNRETDGSTLWHGVVTDITERKRTEDKVIESQAELKKALEISNQSRQTLLSVLEDQREAEKEIQKLNTELEQRVIERTAQLEAANKELETFTYSVSHDLKAPLRGIDGYSKLLSDLYANDLNDEAKHFITTIRSSTQLMSQLIDDLLQYSRLERSQLRSEPVMIKSFINAILKIHEDEISSRRFSVTINIPDTAIIADSNGIQMALRNLIENAIKFTKTVPEPTIEIKQEESENFWILSVKDNGIGFDMKYSQRIFEIFQRLHRVEDYPGTGIGLAMVGKAMQRMNGNARAESNPGQGATFYLEIPKPIE